MRKYTINPCSGMRIEANKGQMIEIVDLAGGQVVDFFAESLQIKSQARKAKK